MGRLLVSSVAGVVVIVAGWWGWTESGRVDAVVTAATDALAPLVPGRGAAHAAVDPALDADERMSVAGTEPAPACPRPAPSSARGMNRLMERLDDEPTLQGGDHGGSVELADGRHLFVYGDTVRDPARVSPFMVRNSVLVVDGGCVHPVTGAGGGAVIPDDEDGTGYWPMSLRAVAVPGGTRVQVVTNRVRGAGDGDFRTLGSSLATFEVPTGRTPRFVGQVRLTPDLDDHRSPTWGAAMWEHDGVLYLFGTASNETKTTAGWSLHVARTAPEDLARPETWEYWDGRRWVLGEPSAARAEGAQLVPAEQGVSHVLSVFTRDGAWYAVSKEGDYRGDTLAVWKAPEVTGPWTKHPVRPLANSTGIQRYTALAHPDIELPSGRLLVSWSESPTHRGTYRTSPELYRPHFAEISLP